jgi:hypothetical protein
VHLADIHTTAHICDDTSTLLPYSGHTVVVLNWITNSSISTSKMETSSPFISVNFYHTSWLHIPYNIILQSHNFDILRAHISWDNDFNLNGKKYLPVLMKTSYMVFHKIIQVISKNKSGVGRRGLIAFIM